MPHESTNRPISSRSDRNETFTIDAIFTDKTTGIEKEVSDKYFAF